MSCNCNVIFMLNRKQEIVGYKCKLCQTIYNHEKEATECECVEVTA